MPAFPLCNEDWRKGVRITEYVRGMQTYQSEMARRIAEVRLSPQEIDLFAHLDRPVKISALSEDWCIDCLMTLPIMAQIADASAYIDLRIFSRSKWLILKEYYNQRGIMAIPVYSFLNDQLEEIGVLVERPQLAHQRVAEWKAIHPEIEEIRRAAHLSSDEKKSQLAQIRLQFQTEMEDWYSQDCQSALVSEVAALLGLGG